jgi:hypothetical protein
MSGLKRFFGLGASKTEVTTSGTSSMDGLGISQAAMVEYDGIQRRNVNHLHRQEARRLIEAEEEAERERLRRAQEIKQRMERMPTNEGEMRREAEEEAQRLAVEPDHYSRTLATPIVEIDEEYTDEHVQEAYATAYQLRSPGMAQLEPGVADSMRREAAMDDALFRSSRR